ncbi:MAG: M20/M25/M40 family metallo-hydrolase [Gemmatimonadaceae bacterium]|nr:M20/M25/M40 family metallo-hydrolase [Gemmatimonadaceae bacterium]
MLLAAHADVVGVEREKWSMDPFAGVIKDGHVYGRGAIDFKGGMAVFAMAALRLAETKVPLARDVIFMAEADEEGAPMNTSWLARDHWASMDAEFALNEGGWIIKDDAGKVRYVSISTADKSVVGITLSAKGTSTHSSMPFPDNAIASLGAALGQDCRLRNPCATHGRVETVLSDAGQDEHWRDQPRIPATGQRHSRAGTRGRPRDLQGSTAARHHAQHHCAGADQWWFSLQRDSRHGRGHTESPTDSGHRSERDMVKLIEKLVKDPRITVKLASSTDGAHRHHWPCDGHSGFLGGDRVVQGVGTGIEGPVADGRSDAVSLSGGDGRGGVALARRAGLRHLPVSDQQRRTAAHARQR